MSRSHAMPLAAGSRLGSYEIVALVGAGGMGEVYLARDLRLGRDVAIKILPPDRLGDESRRRRFVQEAQAASALSHPHIVTIFEIESAGDCDFIVMEYVRGRSLDTAIPRGGLPLGELLRIAISVADALAAAHAHGIVHRDLKPANVMIGRDGVVKVLDFGLAKRFDEAGPPDESTFTIGRNGPLSLPGTIVGTAAYMAPEQATGGAVDARTDIFSFGAMLYEMATGTRAFDGASTADTLAAVIRDQPTPASDLVPTLPADLDRLVVRCLRKEPERRYQAMQDVSLELQEIKEESDAGRVSARAFHQALSRPARWIPVAAVVSLAIAAAAYLVWKTVPKAPERPQQLVPLTAMNGLESQPALSPDGDLVAFEWDGEKNDNADIYLKLVGSTEVRRLTVDPASDEMPAWSPDGRDVAFLRYGKNGVTAHVVSIITGAERKIADLGGGYWIGLTWSPDGRWLALGHATPEPGSGIYLLPVRGGELRRLVTLNRPSWAGYPSFSPDGRSLAFRACATPLRCSLDVLALDAALNPGERRTVTRIRGGENSWAVAWTHDGLSLIYESARSLWRVPVEGGGAPERLELAGPGALCPALAAHRDRLVFVSQRNTVTQHALDTNYASPAILASSYWDTDVQFSPDGSRLVFNSSRSGEGPEIWTARADGTDARQLLRGPGDWQGSPSFSPDGRQLAFDSKNADGHFSIFVVDAEGGIPRPLTTDPGDENQPVWSPDGEWIYYTSDQKAGRNVWRIPAAGGRSEQVTTTGSGFRVRMSPDGREVLYTGPTPAGGDPRLLAVAVTGGGVARTVLSCVREFTTNAIGVYYVACNPGLDSEVRMIDEKTKRDSLIGRTRPVPYAGPGIAVSPDGTSVIVARGEWTRDLMLIENFR